MLTVGSAWPVEPPLQFGFISGARAAGGTTVPSMTGVPTPGWTTCTVIWSPALKVTELEPIVMSPAAEPDWPVPMTV